MTVVREEDLAFDAFRCCGDEDLYPFRCSRCERCMVFCYECNTLYDDLGNLDRQAEPVNAFDTAEPAFCCPSCGHEFEYDFMSNRAYEVTIDAWREAGHTWLLARSRRT